MTLIIISDFMQDEIYLNEEVKYYDEKDKIFFFTVKGHEYSNTHINIPSYFKIGKLGIHYNSIIHRIICLIRSIFRKDMISELKYMVETKKLTFNSLKRLFLFSSKSELVLSNIKKVFDKNQMLKTENLIFYTYRVGFSSLACCRLKDIFPNAKVVSRCHAQDIFEFRNKENYLPYRGYLYNRIDEIHCISEDGMRYLENYDELNNKIFLHRLGTKEIKLNNKINNRNFVILTCSRIARIKRIHVIARALSNIKDGYIKWVHYGDGDEKYLEEIKDIIKNCGSNISVEFRGFCDNDMYLKVIANEEFSVFVNVSESEGLPVSIMEAESVGMPVIATNVGGTSEAVVNGENGILLDADLSEEQLIEAILKFKFMDFKMYNTYKHNSREIWENKFRNSVNYKVFINHLKEI